MYERESGSAEITYDQQWRQRLAAGLEEPTVVPGFDLEANSVVIGNELGRSEHPGPGWKRLRWTELAARPGESAVVEGRYPSFRSLSGARAGGSWPVSIRPPAEGSLDRESWQALIDVLIAWSPDGADTLCVAYFGPAVSGEFDSGVTVSGTLGGAADLYDHPSGVGSPSNLWAANRSWITWSDWDLCATKVAGPTELTEELQAKPELEALRLPWC
ncbi:hypothetical protein K7711_46640 [Nocardia sp. CA2R105]|uniref:hypothetical protein n=1 Tax=Nocardia coffeae TaxID=2873381 RepID=UPI001CA73852|nr:hypothetical protein [Nocardia coffeae]MBY8864011.1 hypothetical protein [Nocardia coffeae]